MTWLRASLFKACSSITPLPPLNMANHITVGLHCLHQQLALSPTQAHMVPTPTYSFHPEQSSTLQAPVRNKTPTDRWYLQSTALFRIANITTTETFPEIWHTFALLTKEKSRLSLRISCIMNPCVHQYKAPRVTHAISVLLLGLHFHTDIPECVYYMVNIFQFPELSLSVDSEAPMFTQRCYTALDANTMTSYADADALMIQQHASPSLSVKSQ